MQLLISTWQFAMGVLKRIYWLAPTLFLDPFDFAERYFKVIYEAPQWMMWVLLSVGISIASIITYHDLRMKKVNLENQQKEKERLDFSILWKENQWFLQETNGFRGGWKSEEGGTGFILMGNLVINSFRRILIEDISLKINEQLFPSDWEVFEYVGFDEPSIRFYLPLGVNRGKVIASIQGKINHENHVLDEFTLEIPEKR